MWNDDWFREMERLCRLIQDRNPFKELQEAQRRREELGLDRSSLERIGMDADRLSAVAEAARLPAEPALQQFAKDMDRIREQTKAIYGTLDLEALDFQKHIKLKSDLVGSLAEMSENIRLHMGDLSAIQGNFGQLAELSRSPVFGYIQDYFDNFVVDEERLREFKDSIANEYIEYSARISTVEEEAEKREIVDQFFDFMERVWKQIQKNPIMVNFIQSLLIGFLFLYLQNIQNQLSEERNREYVDAKLEQFAELTNKEYDEYCEDKDYEEYVVTEKTNVLDSLVANASLLAILQPHMKVYIIEEKEDLCLVHYADQINAVEGEGWVRKDSLEKVID